jgi:ABC-type branched-subunit amino acid transport system ATPase component
VALDGRTGRIVLEQVTQRFALPREGREFTAVQDVSFDVDGGEFVSLVGPSGCGKSTLLALVAGLVPVTAGRISLDGQPVDGVTPRLGFVFQRDGAVVGEYLGAHEGMGYVISYAESMFNATGVLAGLLVLMAAVIAIDLGLKRLDARFSYWKPIPK